MLSGAGASETDACEIIKCSDTFVQLNTTYTDSKRYMFHKVYGSTQPNDSVFAEVLPVVLDTTNGVNAHIIVSDPRVFVIHVRAVFEIVWD
jgi:regulatory protein YycH of two-component signal transduction system YycFG